MDHDAVEGLECFKTPRERGHFTALSSFLSLNALANDLLSSLASGRISLSGAPRYLDQAQCDLSSLGESLSGQKVLLHHRHLMLDFATLADAVRMKRIGVKELVDCLKFSLLDVEATH